MKKYWFLLLTVLSLTAFLIWFSVINYPKETMSVIACDVGQGDSFLVTYKNFQILIDGGPNEKVLGCLSEYMPFWDNSVEVVILSHPQKDHFAGLIKVFENYDVKYFLTTALDSGSQEWSVLKNLVGGSTTKVLNPETGNKYRFGLIYLDILHPSGVYVSMNSTPADGTKDPTNGNVLGAITSKRDPNDFSVVLILSFKEFNALFTGDIGPELSGLVINEITRKVIKDIEYIKVPHHGSKNGLTKELLDAVDPEVAVISAGKDNSYGHPHQEILEMLANHGVRVFRTDLEGDVVVESDGKSIWVK
jgi:competence protein ComEC